MLKENDVVVFKKNIDGITFDVLVGDIGIVIRPDHPSPEFIFVRARRFQRFYVCPHEIEKIGEL